MESEPNPQSSIGLTERREWSATRLLAFHACPRQYLLAYVLRARAAQPVPTNRLFGRLVHEGLSGAYRAAAAEPDYAPGALMARYRDEASEAMTLSIHWVDLQRRGALSSCRDAEREVFVVLEKLPAPHPEMILSVEDQFRVPVPVLPYPGQVDLFLVGVIDLALRIAADAVHVRNWKTATITVPAEQLEQSKQLGFYDLALRALFAWVRQVTVGLYSTRPTGGEIVHEIHPDTLAMLAAQVVNTAEEEALRVSEAYNGGDVDQLFPPRPGENCTGCYFRSYCPVFAGAPLPVRSHVDVAAERDRIEQKLAQWR
jgi:putative RecB family exonuclease